MRRMPVLFPLLTLLIFAGCSWSQRTYYFIKPVQPALADDWMEYRIVDSLQPVLEWTPMKNQFQERQITSYDVAIFRAPQSGNELLDTVGAALQPLGGSEPVYEKSGVKATAHTVEQPLAPGTKYLWTVRAHYVEDGNEAVTPWSAFDVKVRKENIVYSESKTANNVYFNFRTPDASAPGE